MKKLITLLMVFAVISGAMYAQDQQATPAPADTSTPAPAATSTPAPAAEPDFYTAQLDSQDTMVGRLRIVQNASTEGDASAGFYAHALDVLVEAIDDTHGVTELKAADDLALILCARLAEAQHTAAGPYLWRTVETFSNPLVRAEALTALGKVQAVDFIPQVVQLLNDYNLESGDDPMAREQVVYGAIASLEAYKDSSGYLPVFFVTVGWYSERVKSRAREALPAIMDNPTEPLVSVIKSSSYNYATKLGAIEVLEASDVTAQQKAQGAVASLTEAWRTSSNLIAQRSILTRTRKLSLDMVRRYGTEDANVYPSLEKCYRQGADAEEQIAAIAALSALATDDSARILSSFLNDINIRLFRGTLTQEDERMVRVIIPALGNTARPAARQALRSTAQADWTSTVLRLAQDALKKIP